MFKRSPIDPSSDLSYHSLLVSMFLLSCSISLLSSDSVSKRMSRPLVRLRTLFKDQSKVKSSNYILLSLTSSMRSCPRNR
jgi:hypothetical protein